MNVQDYIPLPRLACAVKELVGPGTHVPPYRKFHTLVMDGVIRTVLVNGRHFVPAPDVPAIARMVGLQVPDTAPHAAAEHVSA